jgi:hypothetical protein
LAWEFGCANYPVCVAVVVVVSCFIVIGPDGHEKPIKISNYLSLSLSLSPFFLVNKKTPHVVSFFVCVKNVFTLAENS